MEINYRTPQFYLVLEIETGTQKDETLQKGINQKEVM
jgi:hypothetical protein